MYHTEFLTAELGYVEKALVIGLKRGSQMQPQGIEFIQSEREKVVVNAKDHMVGKTVEVDDTVPRASLPAELQRAISHGILDAELSKEHDLHKWCLLPVQCLPSWFFIFRKWLPGFPVVAAEQLRERYLLSSHGVHGYHKPRGSIQFLPGVSRTCAVPGRSSSATHRVHLLVLLQPKGELKELQSDYEYPIPPLATNITKDSHDIENQQIDACNESSVQRQQGDECTLSNTDSKKHGRSTSTNDDSLLIPIFVRHVSGELAVRVNLGQSSQYLMDLYEQKTKTRLEYQYFIYGRKRLEPDCTLQFYGVEQNITVHVCSGLLGGV